MILYVIIYIYLKIGPCGKHRGKKFNGHCWAASVSPRRILAPVEVTLATLEGAESVLMSQTFNGFDML